MVENEVVLEENTEASIVLFIDLSRDNTQKIANYKIGFNMDGKDYYPIKRYSGFRNWMPIGHYECSQVDSDARKASANYKN